MEEKTMAFSVRRKKDVNVSRVVSKLVVVLITLWVGGVILTVMGTVMNGTTSAFYTGLTLIGWTVSTGGQITATSTSTGVLGVVGLIALASIVLEFIEFKM